MQLEKMITEGSNAASAEIDRVSTLEMCRIINDEDGCGQRYLGLCR